MTQRDDKNKEDFIQNKIDLRDMRNILLQKINSDNGCSGMRSQAATAMSEAQKGCSEAGVPSLADCLEQIEDCAGDEESGICSNMTRDEYQSDYKDLNREVKDAKKEIQEKEKDILEEKKNLDTKQSNTRKTLAEEESSYQEKMVGFSERGDQQQSEALESLQSLMDKMDETQNRIDGARLEKNTLLLEKSTKMSAMLNQMAVDSCQQQANAIANRKVGRVGYTLSRLGTQSAQKRREATTKFYQCIAGANMQKEADLQALDKKIIIQDQIINTNTQKLARLQQQLTQKQSSVSGASERLQTQIKNLGDAYNAKLANLRTEAYNDATNYQNQSQQSQQNLQSLRTELNKQEAQLQALTGKNPGSKKMPFSELSSKIRLAKINCEGWMEAYELAKKNEQGSGSNNPLGSLASTSGGSCPLPKACIDSGFVSRSSSSSSGRSTGSNGGSSSSGYGSRGTDTSSNDKN